MSEYYTQSMIPLKSVYNSDDIRNLDFEKSLNEPGSFPYTRGIRADLHKRRIWIQRELSGEGGPKKSNEQLRYLIERGQLGIDIIGDGPTNSLIDPDHPMAKNAIGTQGVSLCCLQDFRELYRDLPIDQLPVSNSLAAAFAIVSLYLVARERNISPGTLRGSLVQAPFYAEDCGYSTHLPFNLRIRLTADSIEFGTLEMPKFHSFLEDTYFIREAGLTAVEEMALGFIEIRYVVKELLKRGLDIDSFAPRIAILVDCGMDLFEEIAKIRASRRLFARMMRDEFGAKDPRSLAVVIASHTSGLSMTAQQPFNNIVRGALQTMALVLAEVQAVEISAFDEAFRIPSKESHLIGLRTQQVIHCESSVSRVVDPLGGSYFIESLTDQVEKRIWDMILDIESKGDPAELSGKGWFKNFFENAMERYSKEIEEKKRLKVGVNVFQIPDEEDTLLREVAEEKIEPYRERIDEIRAYKEKRNQKAVRETLQNVYQKARETDVNLMYPIIEATEAGATMGEIAGVMRLAYDYPYDPFGMIESPI